MTFFGGTMGMEGGKSRVICNDAITGIAAVKQYNKALIHHTTLLLSFHNTKHISKSLVEQNKVNVLTLYCSMVLEHGTRDCFTLEITTS